MENKLASMENAGAAPELEVGITWQEVWAVICKLPLGKAAGSDGVTAEILRLAGIGFAMALAGLFSECLSVGEWPSAWKTAYVLPLFKGDGLRTKPSNYRTLAIRSVVAKLFEKILDIRLRKWAEGSDKLSDLQGGFRENRSTLDQIFTLNEMVAKRVEDGLPTILTFVDVRKAYDRVWQRGLWWKLRRKGLGGNLLKLLESALTRVRRSVLVDGLLADEATVEAGVPQGSVLSPLLYAIFIDGLHEAMERAGLGVEVFGRKVPLLMYADDIVLLSRDIDDTRRMHKVLEDYASKWRFQINQDKSGIVVVGKQRLRNDVESRVWRLGGDSISCMPWYKYLGIEFEQRRATGKWNRFLERLYKKATAAANILVWRAGGAGALAASTLVRLWKAKVRPIMEYGAELWHGEISNAWTEKLEGLQYNFAKILGCRGASPARTATLAELDLQELWVRRVKLKLIYWGKLCRCDENRLVNVVFRNRRSQVDMGNAARSGLWAMKRTLVDCELANYWRLGSVDGGWHWTYEVAVRRKWRHMRNQSMTLRTSLEVYRRLDLVGGLAHQRLDDINNIRGTRIQSKLRLGIALLMARIARLCNWPRSGSL